MPRTRGSRHGSARSRVPPACGGGLRRQPRGGEGRGMRLKQLWGRGLVATMLVGLGGVTVGAAAGEQFLPVFSVREGRLKSDSIPQANGTIDFLTLLNARDGGINGVPLVWEECETVFDVDRGVACYERL